MHANVCRDFLILRYSANAVIVCPPSCQNFILKDVDVAFHYFLLRDLKSTFLQLSLLCFAGKGELILLS